VVGGGSKAAGDEEKDDDKQSGTGGSSVSAGDFELSAGTLLQGLVTYCICDDEEQDSKLKGGQGQIYKAYCNGSGGTREKDFAVKRPVDRERQSGQQREGQVYWNINPSENSHLAFLNDVVSYNGVPLLVMEWADKSVKDLLDEQQEVRARCPPERLLQFEQKVFLKQSLAHGIQTAKGLVSLHKLKMVHQDLKPGKLRPVVAAVLLQ
jgi:serine/threonine protein kinase